jgi:ribosomal protein S26
VLIRAQKEASNLARKTVLVCDNCGKEVGEGKGATLRLTYTDARRGAKQADLCDNCAAQMPGHAAARRGRRPKAAAAA